MKTKFIAALAALTLGLGLTACDILDVEQPEEVISTLTSDVDFVATKVICKHFTNIYAAYPNTQNFFLEMTGEVTNGECHTIILDLVVPADHPGPEAEYTVGYGGSKYIALSRFDVYDPYTGLQYQGGCYYGLARDGYISDTYGFLTSGTVKIYPLGDDMAVSVNAQSEDHTIKVFYQGPLNIIEGDK